MLLVVARIGRPHGVHGEATIEIRTDSPEKRFLVGSRFSTDPINFGPLTIETVRNHNGTTLLKFKEISDRTEIEKLKDVILMSEVDIDSENSENQFHIQQILNCRVYFEDGQEVGFVKDSVHLPSQDLLVIEYQGREVLVPFVKELVPVVNILDRKIVIVDKEGLFDA